MCFFVWFLLHLIHIYFNLSYNFTSDVDTFLSSLDNMTLTQLVFIFITCLLRITEVTLAHYNTA